MRSNRYETYFSGLQKMQTKHGIHAVSFDWDETLGQTQSLYDRAKKELCSALYPFIQTFHADPFSESDFLTQYLTLDTEAYNIYGADPKRWEYALELLANQYSQYGREYILKQLTYQLPLFDRWIYTQPTELYDGAIDTLRAFSLCGFKNGLVTLSSSSWTKVKLDYLRQHFGYTFDHVRSVGVIGTEQSKRPAKTAEDWAEDFAALGCEAQDVLVIGDSINDVKPALEAGCQHTVLLRQHTDNLINAVHGDVPEKTLIVTGGIANVIPTLLAHLKIKID